jgi:hypothetical protein
MKKNLKNLFSPEVQKNLGLSDESLVAIQEALEGKIDLAVEAALQEQDDVYAEKLQNLVTSIDKDRTQKMKKVMESFDKYTSAKLIKVVKKYEREQETDLKGFKQNILESLNEFIGEFINETISKEDLAQAVKNKTAYAVLENMRKVLAIDSAVMNQAVAAPIIEGKQEIDKLRKENDELKKSVKLLTEDRNNAQIKLLLESKTAKYPETKKNFIKKALGDKSLKFIQENFDYTVRLFENQEKKQLRNIADQAVEDRKHKPDFVKEQKIVEEKVNNDKEQYDPYIEELKKMRF